MNNFIDIYSRYGKTVFDFKPASIKREWMDETAGHAYKCLPLNIANQYGWTAYCPTNFSATWDGSNSIEAITIEKEEDTVQPQSHFGWGILTIPTDFIIKTNKDVSIYVRGVSNYGYEKVYPLDGLIETDWLPFPFTMNYKFKRPGTQIFKKGDPLFMVFPVQRGFIESFSITNKKYESNPELHKDYEEYFKLRSEHLDRKDTSFQKFYLKGQFGETQKNLSNHKIRLDLNFPESSV